MVLLDQVYNFYIYRRNYSYWRKDKMEVNSMRVYVGGISYAYNSEGLNSLELCVVVDMEEDKF